MIDDRPRILHHPLHYHYHCTRDVAGWCAFQQQPMIPGRRENQSVVYSLVRCRAVLLYHGTSVGLLRGSTHRGRTGSSSTTTCTRSGSRRGSRGGEHLKQRGGCLRRHRRLRLTPSDDGDDGGPSDDRGGAHDGDHG